MPDAKPYESREEADAAKLTLSYAVFPGVYVSRLEATIDMLVKINSELLQMTITIERAQEIEVFMKAWSKP